mmetsp:Transcript_35652/g.53122  ORF Transcript_35652/g.53122 Transcript_35652/m.53122 type:complete len:282 (+) Transcript_35652:211-1056(+)
MDKGTFHVHEIELVIDTAQGFGNGRRVGNHTHSTLDASQVSTRNCSGNFPVDTTLETSGTPVNKLDRALRLHRSDSSVHVLRDNISTVHQATGHVFSVTRITLGHHVGRFEDRVCDLRNGELFVVGLVLGNDGGIRCQHEMDARVRHQVGLELSNINVQGTIETQGRRKGRDDLCDQPVEVGVRRTLNIEIATTDIVQSFVVKTESAVRMFQKSMSGQDGVVRLNDSRRNARGRRDSKRELALTAVVDRETLQQERPKTRPSTSSGGMEDQETLETSAAIR